MRQKFCHLDMLVYVLFLQGRIDNFLVAIPQTLLQLFPNRDLLDCLLRNTRLRQSDAHRLRFLVISTH